MGAETVNVTRQRSIFDERPVYRGLATQFGWRAWVARGFGVLFGAAVLLAQTYLLQP